MTALFVPVIAVILHIFIAHERNGHISTSGLKSDVTVVSCSLTMISYKMLNLGDSRTFKADIGLRNIGMNFQDLLA